MRALLSRRDQPAGGLGRWRASVVAAAADLNTKRPFREPLATVDAESARLAQQATLANAKVEALAEVALARARARGVRKRRAEKHRDGGARRAVSASRSGLLFGAAGAASPKSPQHRRGASGAREEAEEDALSSDDDAALLVAPARSDAIVDDGARRCGATATTRPRSSTRSRSRA